MQQRQELTDAISILEDLTDTVLNSLSDSDLTVLKDMLDLTSSEISLILRNRKHQRIHFHPESNKTD